MNQTGEFSEVRPPLSSRFFSAIKCNLGSATASRRAQKRRNLPSLAPIHPDGMVLECTLTKVKRPPLTFDAPVSWSRIHLGCCIMTPKALNVSKSSFSSTSGSKLPTYLIKIEVVVVEGMDYVSWRLRFCFCVCACNCVGGCGCGCGCGYGCDYVHVSGCPGRVAKQRTTKK